jgi:8-oxo-dGTP pyrophosphatase MutT (NUDIX family)
MKGDLKIYYNDSFLLATSDRAQMNKNFATILDDEKQITDFLKNADFLFDGKTNRNILLLTDKPAKILEEIRGITQLVIAGGGIVFNERDELLMIHRRGKWDLAKGKIEKGEKIEMGAVREVEEETGVLIQNHQPEPLITYHAYKLKGKNSLKETSWYAMKAKPGQNKLVPQVEEDIDEVRWVKKGDIKNYQQGSHLLIWDLISGLQ